MVVWVHLTGLSLVLAPAIRITAAEMCRRIMMGRMIGTEHEKFGFEFGTLKPMKYDQTAELLNVISERFDWEKIMEGEYIIGLKHVDQNYSPSNLATAALVFLLASDGQDDCFQDYPSCICFLIFLSVENIVKFIMLLFCSCKTAIVVGVHLSHKTAGILSTIFDVGALHSFIEANAIA
ncbi:glutamate-cysteine ligase [Perilla frutescens var. frutescens]|nr:glutamate-cysteine ligase [Perilla frutescens var. frutescens]